MDMVKNEWEGPNYSNWSNGISVRSSDNILIQGNHVSLHTIGIALSDGATQVIVEDNTMEYCRQGMWAWISEGISATDSIVRNNECSQSLSNCITIRRAERVVVEGNIANYSAISQYGMGMDSRDCVLRNNFASHGGFYTETMEHPGSSCISIWTAGERNLVEGNYCAYHLDPTTWDGNGIIIDLSPNTKSIVRRNILYRNQGSGVTFTASPEVAFYNNVMAENGLNHPDVTPGTSNANRNGAGLRFAREEDVGHLIMNNIFHLNETSCVYSGGRLLNQPLVDYNLYSPYPGTPLIKDSWNESREFFSIADIQADSGREANGLEGDPEFVDSDGLDFRLQDTSPAIDHGGCLTLTTSAGSGTQLPVQEASFFFGGIPRAEGDLIVVGANDPVRLTAVDTAGQQLTLESSIDWQADDPVCLVFEGAAPDMGAHEWSDVCEPSTCEALGAECGSIDDGCGTMLDCGSCTPPDTCGAVTANQCDCLPTTCQAESKNCGEIPDGCDGTLDCGSCSGTEVCGAEEPNVCGEGTCVPDTCEDLGAECGQISDGCADVLDCGTCESPEVCGADNQCTCEPTTCEALSVECGEHPDGCGGTLDCGDCEEESKGSGCSCGTFAGTGRTGLALLALVLLGCFRRFTHRETRSRPR
jgi:parallel beta-helix repeat protein